METETTTTDTQEKGEDNEQNEIEEKENKGETKKFDLKTKWYFIDKEGKKQGPVDFASLRKHEDPKLMIWREGLVTDWISFEQGALFLHGDAWYYIDEVSAQQGPCSKWHIIQLAVSGTGEITPETLVWKYGTQDWQPLNDLDDLRDACGFQKIHIAKSADNETAAPDQELDWYYEDEYRKKQGPVNKPELLIMLDTQKIHPTTLVWKVGMEDWLGVQEVLFKKKDSEIKKEVEEIKEEDIRHRLTKKVALTKLEDENSKIIGTLMKASVVQIIEIKEKRCRVHCGSLKGWINVEDDDKPLLERVKTSDLKRKRKRKKKKKWKAMNASAVYVSGLPADTHPKEIGEYFKKCGSIKRDVLTGQLKVKLYTNDDESLKGDAIVHYFKQESVKLAVDMLDETNFREGVQISVKRAEFTQKGETFKQKKRQKITPGQRFVMREIYKSYKGTTSWEEDPDKIAPNLKIVVLKHMFNLQEVEFSGNADRFYETLRVEIGQECQRVAGEIEKVTVFDNNPEGVVIVRFKAPSSSAACIDVMHGRFFAGRRVECFYWDGATDYRIKESDDQEDKRIEEFGKFLTGAEEGKEKV